MICEKCKKDYKAAKIFVANVDIQSFDRWGYPIFKHQHFCEHTQNSYEEIKKEFDQRYSEIELRELIKRFPARPDLHKLKKETKIPLSFLITYVAEKTNGQQ